MAKNDQTKLRTNHAKTLTLFLIASAVGLLIFLNTEEQKYSNLQNDQLQKMLTSKIPIYDVRRADEWRNTGIIEGSRTKALARYLTNEFGYTKLFNVEDGITRWIRDKRPVQMI